ncbi:peptide ABC transporter ATP-binding protein [Meridianimarinicoccus roseus]|jgi:oligopeptide/dipeptide ABC transporter ATP-binding protein|uniref:Peptide ABC transporter ATP-binding protein n=1 Tax=Meridianimarinicoccus roseus TaxID=2072018 RepID=A0A2V2L9J7_9RHOB|nr:ABC transporter ATP-binding protein [Meridianimarinicoccus roseus]PWR02090.1 peptide ABC transporter ATP-binding protein [Meridianimarinicoccus roseus]
MTAAAPPPPLLEARGLCKTFGGGLSGPAVRAVDDVTLIVRRGETVALVGESGSGKSTFGRLLNGLIVPDAGEVRFDDGAARGRTQAARRALSRKVQMVFQDPMASLNPRHRIAETLSRPLFLHGLADSRAQARDRAAELLEEVGIAQDALDRFPHEFSGGQRQRIGIARALSVGPECLICDEPVSALDVSVQAQIVGLLETLKSRHGLAQLFIAHDLALVRKIADRVAVMYRGRIVEEGPAAALFAAPAHPYTRALLDAVPRIGCPARPLPIGTTAQGAETGCNFAPRCPRATGICCTQRPRLEGLTQPTHLAACHHPLSDPVAAPDGAEGQERVRRIAAFGAALAQKKLH